MNADDPKAALETAIAVIGSGAELARQLGIPKTTVSSWLHRSGKCSPEKAVAIEHLTGVSRHALRPDIFGATA